MQVVEYTRIYEKRWDEFVDESINGNFLFHRQFMEYHKDRFIDSSLLIFNDKKQLVGLFPADKKVEEKLIRSHGGLTYGGLILKVGVSYAEVADMMLLVIHFFKNQLYLSLVYKTIPFIYYRYPSSEIDYFLFRIGAKLLSRAISSTIDLRYPLPFSYLRKRKLNKAQQIKLQVSYQTDKLKEFWNILTANLQKRHQVLPTHSLLEISKLIKCFPENIQLDVVYKNDKIIAGALLFISKFVVHVQYITASNTGFECGALDFLFAHLISKYIESKKIRYIDFGVSTENGGRKLNEGLLFQKEGLGGRAICYDTYLIKL